MMQLCAQLSLNVAKSARVFVLELSPYKSAVITNIDFENFTVVKIIGEK